MFERGNEKRKGILVHVEVWSAEYRGNSQLGARYLVEFTFAYEPHRPILVGTNSNFSAASQIAVLAFKNMLRYTDIPTLILSREMKDVLQRMKDDRRDVVPEKQQWRFLKSADCMDNSTTSAEFIITEDKTDLVTA